MSQKTKSKLLYRGSRDGFGAKFFHFKCDNIPKTLAIIETTKGSIFGGYTEQNWNGKQNRFARDQNAFIFSLVNDFRYPFLMKIINPDLAIIRNDLYGPVFGDNDIFISDNSNIGPNYSYICNYCLPKQFENNPYILANDEEFEVKEIEVFQIVF